MVDKAQLQLAERQIVEKEIEYLDGEQPCTVPSDRQLVPCVTEEELVELASMGKRLERLDGGALDIEWAIDAQLPFPDGVVLLQCRPETVWSQQRRAPLFDEATALTAWVAHGLTRPRGPA